MTLEAVNLIQLTLVGGAGLLGASHCLGMCGPFTLIIGSASPSAPNNLLRQGFYTLGRIFTYGVLGSAAGFAGQRLAAALPALVNLPAVLALLAGTVLIYQGLLGLGLWRPRAKPAGHGPCLSGPFLMTFLKSPGRLPIFLAGVVTGFLPCGLLYAMLAMAGSTGSLLAGGLIMIAFGLGTAPPMILFGWCSALLGMGWRTRILQIGAACVILAGGVSLVRGLGFLAPHPQHSAAVCPFCLDAEVPPSEISQQETSRARAAKH